MADTPHCPEDVRAADAAARLLRIEGIPLSVQVELILNKEHVLSWQNIANNKRLVMLVESEARRGTGAYWVEWRREFHDDAFRWVREGIYYRRETLP